MTKRLGRTSADRAKPVPVTKAGKAVKILAHNKQIENKNFKVRTGTVTAVRWDGTVNLTLGGTAFRGVACAQSYTNRLPGDRVQVVQHGGMPFVIGVVGADPNAVVPTIFPTEAIQYTWAMNGTDGSFGETHMYVNEGANQRIGRRGSNNPVYGETDQFYQALYGFWNGAANILNNPADTTHSIDVFVGRDDWDDGDPGPASLSLWPHDFDALPVDGQLVIFDVKFPTGIIPPNIDFTLEPGELKVITLPDTWRNSIGASPLGTFDIRGFAIRPGAAPVIPFADDNSYAFMDEITCSVRIY